MSFRSLQACKLFCLLAIPAISLAGDALAREKINLAVVAVSSTSYVSGHETILGLNSGFDPRNSNDKRHGAYGNWPQQGSQWVEYTWSQPITTSNIAIYWFDDHNGVRLPKACRLLYDDGGKLVPVGHAVGLGLKENAYNPTTFDEVTTTRLRVEIDSNHASTGILQWKVYDTGKSPNFPPRVDAGPDRAVVVGGHTRLLGVVKDDGKLLPAPKTLWSKEAGPGTVSFDDPQALDTTARFDAAGQYVLMLTADDGELKGAASLKVDVFAAPQKIGDKFGLESLEPIPYKVNSPLWSDRLKQVIIHWIPHCYKVDSDPKLECGGIENFVRAGDKLAGRPYGRHIGAVFANTWTYNIIESMSLAQLLDPQGDAEILAAQKAMRDKLEDWIPKILSAQEPDGYLHTYNTLNNLPRWHNKDDHEGYQTGYFIEAALAHYESTGRKDDRLYRAARKMADLWCNTFGPAPKRMWYDGHEELEQSLARLARFVDATEGTGAGRKYLDLAGFLLSCRRGGDSYDQSHLPVTEQYEALGHSVRAMYLYSGMSDYALATGDLAYLGATKSLWDNLVRKKYYITGGVGSGETSEGFGANYSLPNNAYCESCADCGGLFFHHKMDLIHRDAQYADLAEVVLYNAILGSVDLPAENFTYTNPLDSMEHRYKWHGCPCCIGNIPRTLLMLPRWMYARGDDGLYVNMFIGSSCTVADVVGQNGTGTDVEMTQTTDYPWNGKVSIVVKPSKPVKFALHVRVPNRQVTQLYKFTPEVSGLTSLTLNGEAVQAAIGHGYAVIDRLWQPGDRVELELPLGVQRARADDHVKADRGRVALCYGPLVYNIESVDHQNVDATLSPDEVLTAEWRPDLLGGVMAIRGRFADGTPLTAIPNYARLNRGGRSLVWIKEGKGGIRD
jgi:DUF1680 family protein